MTEKQNPLDLDLQFRLRSSKMSVQDLQKITTNVVATLLKDFELDLLDQNVTVNTNSERKLITVTSNFQSKK